MAYTNYQTQVLRASGVTTGTSEQDTAVTIGESVSGLYIVVDKTVEFNGDNLLTVRLQAQVGTDWFDVDSVWQHRSVALTVASDVGFATLVARTPNAVDASNDPTPTWIAYYDHLPSRTIRVASVSSGTGVLNTFSVTASYRLNQL